MKLDLTIPENDKIILSEIGDFICNSSSAYISWHARPDGDAIGGGTALYSILKNFGLDVEIISPTKLPKIYSFLNYADKVKMHPSSKKKDILFILDCSDTYRLEKVNGLFECAGTIINIDHHQLNREFGDINYVRPESSSVCELILNIALHLDIEFSYEIALCLYVGILTDTNRFQEPNTTAHSHMIAAELIKNFISPVKVASLIYGNNDLNTLHLISMAINSLKLSSSKKIGYITITQSMLTETGTTDENIEGIINYARNIKGVEVGILFRKIPGLDGVKVSFRSKGRVDVSVIASQFGGGGHRNAAGCLIDGGFDKVKNKLLNLVDEKINNIEAISNTM